MLGNEDGFFRVRLAEVLPPLDFGFVCGLPSATQPFHCPKNLVLDNSVSSTKIPILE